MSISGQQNYSYMPWQTVIISSYNYYYSFYSTEISMVKHNYSIPVNVILAVFRAVCPVHTTIVLFTAIVVTVVNIDWIWLLAVEISVNQNEFMCVMFLVAVLF